jgi:hypothetical protein
MDIKSLRLPLVFVASIGAAVAAPLSATSATRDAPCMTDYQKLAQGCCRQICVAGHCRCVERCPKPAVTSVRG